MGAGASVGDSSGHDGVPLHHLGIRLSCVEALLQLQGGRSALQTLTFHDLQTQLVQPALSSTPDVSYIAHILSRVDVAHTVGKATHNLLYLPQQAFLPTVDSLLRQYEAHADEVVLWIDIFSLPLEKLTYLKMTTDLLDSPSLTQSIVALSHWNCVQKEPASSSQTYSLALVLIQLYLNLQQSHQVDICIPPDVMQDLVEHMCMKGFLGSLQNDVLSRFSVQFQLEDNSEEVLEEALPILQKIEASVGVEQCDELLRNIVTLAFVNLLLPHPYSRTRPPESAYNNSDNSSALPPPSISAEHHVQPPVSPRISDTNSMKKLYFQENLAHLLLSIGQTEHAKDLFQHYLDVQKSTQHNDDNNNSSTEVIQSMQQLADVFLILQDFASAKNLYEEALQLVSTTCSDHSAEYIHFLQHVASMYLQHEIVHEGLIYAESGWQLSVAWVGYFNELSLESLKLLLHFYVALDDHQAMRALYETVQKQLTDTQPANATETENKYQIEMKLRYLNLFGMFAFQSHDASFAKDISEHCLAVTKQEYGAAHANTWNAMNNMMNLFTNIEEFDAAEHIAEDIVASKTAALGSQASSTLSSRITLANFYMIRGKHDQARSLLSELGRDCEEVFGADHPETMDVKKQLEDIVALQTRSDS